MRNRDVRQLDSALTLLGHCVSRPFQGASLWVPVPKVETQVETLGCPFEALSG